MINRQAINHSTKLGFVWCFVNEHISDKNLFFMKRVTDEFCAILRIDQVREVCSVAIIPTYWRYIPTRYIDPTWFTGTVMLERGMVDDLIVTAMNTYLEKASEKLLISLENL